MLNRLRKHGVKILVFTINILLAAIAVLVIRIKDQARLLEDYQGKDLSKERQSGTDTPSFKENLKLDSSDSNPADTSFEIQPDPVNQNPTDKTVVPPSGNSVPTSNSSPYPAPSPSVPQTTSPDRKTKTS